MPKAIARTIICVAGVLLVADLALIVSNSGVLLRERPLGVGEWPPYVADGASYPLVCEYFSGYGIVYAPPVDPVMVEELDHCPLLMVF